MNYDLAKKLKDVGFKQYGNGTLAKCPPGSTESDIAYIPTLSELIEACGREFKGLATEWEDGEMYFVAVSENGFQNNPMVDRTPTEAVANLWLALNKKE